MALRTGRNPILLPSGGGGRVARTSSYQSWIPGSRPDFGGGFGYSFNGNGGGGGGGGGGAPSWMCALLGRSQCSYADLIAAGVGWVIGGAGSGGGGGSEPPPGNGSTPGFTGDSPASGGCPDGQIGYPPLCFDVQPGGGTTGGGVVVTQGEAVMGRYGAALQPMTRTQTVARCLPGMVLGNDGLCYNRRDLRKDERKWVPGRKPLLTGGDLNAISRAARAARRVKTQQKRLEKLGLLKKPSRGRPGGSPGVITKAEAARALRK